MSAAFRQEHELLHALVAPLDEEALRLQTQFRGWTVEDVIIHLHGWNEAVSLALTAPARFAERLAASAVVMREEGMRTWDRSQVSERGKGLVEAWRRGGQRLADLAEPRDPKERIAWVGPPMSLRTALAARQMETWAHGSEVFDRLGATREETDRIRPIVELGWKTFGWSWKVRGEEPPERRPAVALVAPSGADWRWPGDAEAGSLAGAAVDFAAVVTQIRHVDDTHLVVRGPIARGWMERAQCFAGEARMPPPPGTRFRVPPSR